MLYNKNWDTIETMPTKTLGEVLSTECFVAWLETYPADKTYEYANITSPCLQQQYFMAMGYTPSALGNELVTFKGHGTRNIPYSFKAAANIGGRPSTFGAALERAKAFLK
jgi:hypothetical protein